MRRERPAPPVRRCAIYTRKSVMRGLEQEFNSLDAQREACAGYIHARAGEGWRALPEAFEDGGFTGANTNRPGFQALLAAIDAGAIDVVIVHRVDRLSRSLLDFARIMARLDEAGVAFVSVTQNFSTADAMGRLTLNMLMSFAEFEREMIAERIRDKIGAARRKGKWTGGSVPFGYDAIDKKLVPNGAEADVVRELFALYLERRSVRGVVRALNDRGRRTKLLVSEEGSARGGTAWNKESVLRVLRSPIHAGWMPLHGELFEGEHAPLVTRETWERAQALLADQTARPRRPSVRNYAYWLRGLIHCDRCGAAMTPASTTKNGKQYRYYRCVTRTSLGTDVCASKPLPAGAIEQYVLDQLGEVVGSGALTPGVMRTLGTRIKARRAELEDEKARLPGLIGRLSAEGQALAARISQADGSAAKLLDERLAEVGRQLDHAQGRMLTVGDELVRLDERAIDTGWLGSVLRDLPTLWTRLTIENRYRLAHALIEDVRVDEPAEKVTVVLADLDAPANEAEAA